MTLIPELISQFRIVFFFHFHVHSYACFEVKSILLNISVSGPALTYVCACVLFHSFRCHSEFQWHFIRSLIALVFNGLRLLICIQSQCRMLIFNGRHSHNIPEISHSASSFCPNYTFISPQRCLLSLSLSIFRHQYPFPIRLEFYTSIWFIFYSLDFNLWKSEIVIVFLFVSFFLRGDYRHQVHVKMVKREQRTEWENERNIPLEHFNRYDRVESALELWGSKANNSRFHFKYALYCVHTYALFHAKHFDGDTFGRSVSCATFPYIAMKIRSTHEVCVGRVLRVFIHFILMPRSSSTRDYSLWICIFRKNTMWNARVWWTKQKRMRRKNTANLRKIHSKKKKNTMVFLAVAKNEAHTTLPKRNGMTKMRKFRRKLNRVENE